MGEEPEKGDLLRRELSKSALPGETWYLVDAKWLKSVKQFLGILPSSGPVSQPGPVDNSRILADDLKELRKGLAESCEFEIINEACWNLLVSWYGTVPGQAPIPRQAVSYGNNYTVVEIYPLVIPCFLGLEKEKEIKLKFSKADSISLVHERLRSAFGVPDDVVTRVGWSRGGGPPVVCPPNDASSLLDLGLADSNVQLYLCLPTDEEPPTEGSENTNKSYQTEPSTSRNNILNNAVSVRSSRASAGLHCSNPLRLPGVCGLNNLGLTCFMNSVIQCLSNTPPLTEYFLSKRHLAELNTTNPLGMRGEIAKAYGELIQTMWSGRVTTTSPLQFKIQVAKFNPQFYHSQHDAQELLTFLLDGLHEDLNRVTNKPYIENKDYNGQEDHVVAKESWENYRKRNDSIVVDTFHGLLKSRVVCPQCERLSVTFDPFCTLSLPLPLKKDRYLKVRYVPYDPLKRECLYRVVVPRRGQVRDLTREVAAKAGANPACLVLAEISGSHFHQFYPQDEALDAIDDKDVIYVYEMAERMSDPDSMLVPVCFWEVCQPEDRFSPHHLFGVPFLAILPRRGLSLEVIVQGIAYHMQRHFALPDCLRENNTLKLSKENSYLPSLYLLDTQYATPTKLEFDENGQCIQNLTELLDGENPSRVFGRKVLVVGLSVSERQELYRERPADYGADLGNLRGSQRSADKNKIQIYDCFDLFTTCEKLGEQNAWYCSTCKKHQRATKKFDLWLLPKVLIVHLKRFSYNRGGDKIDKLVRYPSSNLDLSRYVINPEQQHISYDLLGVINHYGTTTAGHYTAYCKNKESNSWYYFNDDSVSPVNSDQLVSPNAYLLFYYRNDSRSPTDDVAPTPMDVN